MGFMMQIRPEVLKKLREDYPPGTKVELIEMIGGYIDAGFAMKPEYEEGRKDRFEYLDDQNCFRICEVLRKRNYGF